MRLSRRAALLGMSALPLAGCSLYDTWFGDEKEKLPGTRVAVIGGPGGIAVDKGTPPVRLPPARAFEESPQAGGTPAHGCGHMAAQSMLAVAWSSSIGAGAGYRARLSAPPVIGGGRVYVMDSDARVSALDTQGGGQIWRATTRDKDDRSTNVGGGIALADGVVIAATGRAELVGLDAASGAERWRQRLPAPARSAPTVADGHIYVTTIDDTLVGLKQGDGSKLWSMQAPAAETSVFGLPTPLAADGLVVAGFSSGELRAVRAASGTNVWGDSLAAARGRIALSDLASIHATPSSADGRLYAGGLGHLLVAIDIRSGRRLWEREVTVGEMPWIGGDWLFVVTMDSRVAAIARADGRVAWTTPLDQWQDTEKQRDAILWAGPVLAGERLYLASNTGVVAVLDPLSGAELRRFEIGAAAALAPVPAGGALYIVTDDGALTCLR